MKNRNSGLGCGCSSGGDLSAVPMAPFLTPQSAAQTAKYTANPGMTVNPAATRQAVVAVASPAQRWRQYFREGIAFGVAWTTGLEQGRTVPAQWSLDLERAAGTYGVPVSPTGAVPSDREAFVAGFDAGIRIVMGSRLELMALNGRRYRLDLLLAQGRVAANNLFGQTRPAVLPIVSTTSMAPMTPGVVARVSTYDQFMGIARAAIAANLASFLSDSVRRMNPADPHEAALLGGDTSALVGVKSPFAGPSRSAIPTEEVFSRNAIYNGVYSARNPAAVWALFLMGNMGSLLEAPRTLDKGTYDAIQAWADFQRLPTTWGAGTPAGPYIRAILNTPWAPQSR